MYIKPFIVFILILINFSTLAQISFTSVDTVKFYTNNNVSKNSSVIYQDLDGDNVIDVLIIREFEIVMKKGNNDGTFLLEKLLFTKKGEAIYSVSNLYDLNDDGYLDIALISYNNISVLMGSPNGFSLTQETYFETYYGTIEWRDYNDDGKVDLLTENNTGIQINYDWENDLSNFEILFEAALSYDFKFLDINLDNKLDLMISNSTDYAFYIKDENNQFAEVYKVNFGFLEMHSGDLNLDGYLDFAYTKNNEIYTLIFDPNNNTFNELNITSDEDHNNLNYIVVADVDNNNSLDVAFVNAQGNLSYKLNSGGNFQPSTGLVFNGVTSPYVGLKILDINSDDQNDIVINGLNNHEIFLLGSGLILIDENRESFSPKTNDMIFGDLDQDGNNDIIVLSGYGKLVVRWGGASIPYSEISEYDITMPLKNGIIYDFDNNGINDIVFSNENAIEVLYGLGARELSPPNYWQNMYVDFKPLITDLNNDGNNELLYSNAAEIVWFDPLSSPVDEYLNTSSKIELIDRGITDVTVHDWNGDGFKDMATSNRITKDISILINNGSTLFSETTIDIGKTVLGLEGFDFNADGKLDLIIATEDLGVNKLEFYTGNNDGTFDFYMNFDLVDTYMPSEIKIVDLDADGDDDIIVSSWDYLSTNIFENVNGNFQLYTNSKFSSLGQGVRAYVDVNMDNYIDAVTSTITNGNLYYQLNNTVQNPTIDNLVAATINVTYNSFSLEMNNTDNSGKFVVVKEGANQILTDLPSDNVYYTVNESFGIGSALDGGHVVYSGDGLIADISGLSPVQDYTVFVFEYNNNEPDNTVINYSDDYLSLQLKTSTSVFLLQEFGIIEFEEDTETEVILNTYINDIGSNSYTITSSNDNILAENIDGNITFSSSENFFGESTITVAVVNDYEQTQFDFLIKVTPINDAPILSEVADLVTYELITSEFELVISDVDNANSELSFNVSSSDEMVVEISSINIQLLENIFVLSLTPSNYGISEIGIEVSDGELINAKKFRYTVEEVVGIEGLTEVNIYPNPVQNYINVIGKNENSEYVIYDIYGRELMTDFVRNSLIDISELKSGRYILKIEGNTNQFIKE